MAKKDIKASMTENQKAAEEFSEYAAKAQKEFMETNAEEREEVRKDPQAFLKKKREEVFAEVERYQKEMAKLVAEEIPFSRESIEVSQAEFYENTGHTSLAQIAKTAEEVGIPTLALVSEEAANANVGAISTKNADVSTNKKQVENEKENVEAARDKEKTVSDKE